MIENLKGIKKPLFTLIQTNRIIGLFEWRGTLFLFILIFIWVSMAVQNTSLDFILLSNSFLYLIEYFILGPTKNPGFGKHHTLIATRK